jgi:hypothetical protein
MIKFSIYLCSKDFQGRDNVVGIATGYRLDDRQVGV